MKVRWLLDALADLEAIADHIAEDDPVAACETTERLLDLVDLQLPNNPHIGRVCEHIPDARELIDSRSRYIIVYRVRSGVVEILRVRHAARRWPPKVTG